MNKELEENNTNQSKKEIKTIKNNSQIVLIYRAKMCNPNGDPGNQNIPRNDPERHLALVSPFRVKRYHRNYFQYYKSKTIYIPEAKRDEPVINAKTSIANILNIENKENVSIGEKAVIQLLDKAHDLSVYGGVLPNVKFESKKNASFTGPVQYAWTTSLNRVDKPINSSQITSHFQSGKIADGDEKSSEMGGTIGSAYCLAYAVFALHATISAKLAEYTRFTDDHVNLLDEAMINAIQLTTTSSKNNQYPLLYIRVQYNVPTFLDRDLTSFIVLTDKDDKEIPFDETKYLSSHKDYKIDLTKLVERLTLRKDKIKEIIFWRDPCIGLNGWNVENNKIKLGDKEIPIITKEQ